MKTLRGTSSVVALLAAGFIFGLNAGRAQMQMSQLQAGGVSALRAVPAQELQPMSSPPPFGNFYTVQQTNVPPLPFDPFPQLPVYEISNQISNHVFLIDDSAVDYTSAASVRAARGIVGEMNAMDASWPPGFGDFGDGTGSEIQSMTAFSFPTNGLWLEITGVSNNFSYLILHGTTNDVAYEILSKQSLTDAVWQSEGTFLGVDNQDWTPYTVPVLDRTNSLFLWARSWIDSDGSGLPDWWQLKYFGQTGVDPYADPDNDGWNNLQEFQNGTDPTHFNTPPPPQNVMAQWDSTGSNIVVTWQSGGGPVSSYAVEDWAGNQIGTVNENTFTFAENFTPDFTMPQGWPAFQVRAYFSNGSSAVCAPVSPPTPSLNLNMQVFRGPSGGLYLAVQSPPPELSFIRVFWSVYNPSTGNFDYAHLDIYATNLVNGIVQLPVSQMSGYSGYLAWMQAFDSNVKFGPYNWIWLYSANERWYSAVAPVTNCVSAAAHLKQNLKFLLRSATVHHAFGYYSWMGTGTGVGDFSGIPPFDDPQDFFVRQSSPTNYEYAGYHIYSPSLNFSFMQELRPVEDNYLWRNFVFNAPNFDYTGAEYVFAYELRYLNNDDPGYPTYQYLGSGTETPLPSALTNYTQMYHQVLISDNDLSDPNFPFAPDSAVWLADLGLYQDANLLFHLPTGAKNLYGLPINSIYYESTNTGGFVLLNPGGTSVTRLDAFDDSGVPCTFGTDEPSLQTVDYYFVSETPYFNYQASYPNPNGPVVIPTPPMPGSPTFSVTNASPLIITGFGQPITVSGWAKQQINNGYSGKYAYLEQYFTNAYVIGTNGVATTNKAGLISPYGEFLPTVPGPAALVTMPDIETGQRGTGVVNVIKIQLDCNHDSVMDLSFGGPDNTSQARPFVFWINNDNDGTGVGHDIEGADVPDSSDFKVRSQRGLEDFARLWVLGMPALSYFSGNYSVNLSWRNVASGSPSIKIFRAFESNGGIGYLTDTNIANGQLGNAYNTMLGIATNGNTFWFPLAEFENTGDRHYLFEGAGVGSGELVLTIIQNGKTNAQTSAWIDLHDVKVFYERAVITNITSGAISNWTSAIQTVKYAKSSALSDDNDLIVFVHGINVGNWDWLNEGDTVFKRLYWAGYHGKFATVKWPCEFFNGWLFLTQNFTVFNDSEIKAYKAGVAMKTYTDQLHTRFPNYRLHLLAHSQGNSVVSEAIEQGAAFDTYILTQGALPASSYDVNAPLNSALTSYESTYGPTPEWKPMGYRGVYTNLPGRIVNFYNTNDPALDIWISAQGFAKPNVPNTDYHYNGTTGTYEPPFGSSYVVTDPQESRAYISRSRTLPIGQSPPESQHGVIQSGVDLHVRYGFDKAFPDDHSAQWAWPIQTTRPYYLQVRESIKP